ncbi:PREDICTED: palmitoyltransferase ZDHHC22-like [Priapulus caudatus]|uniref:Palmitoyltransferase n=1 Tax=Priapulus caudatus TaxID=37621 RepID=A0ABM1F4G2_PRICU|nr:PREDICTED: palmitoyltransferase ZDHHC22-like [Priapulus caudatus]
MKRQLDGCSNGSKRSTEAVDTTHLYDKPPNWTSNACLGVAKERLIMENVNPGYFSTDPYFPIKVLNYSLVVYTATLTVLLLYVSLSVTIPFASGEYSFLQYLAWYLFFSVLLNWMLILKNSSVFTSNQFVKTSEEGDKYCDICKHWIPPRGHHCVLCMKCILRRDHHCYFTGTCIGFRNQRYFVVFCFDVSVSCGLGWYFLMLYLDSNFKTFWSEDNYHYLLPLTFVEWLLRWGGIQAFDLFLLTLAWWSFATFVTALVYFSQQMFVIVRGQTSYEYSRDVHTYRTVLCKHLKSVFGPFWVINFAFPLFFIQQEGNGISYVANLKEV